jgi:(p)ppGpp synthase/HD superfamily hydrolase
MSEKYTKERLLSPAFNEAVSWALDLHANHLRKGTAIPYVSHLMAVTANVLEAGGTETEAMAAILHDAVEDTAATVEDVRERFGDEVAGIVDGCSDADVIPKPPWKARKLAYIEHLKEASESVLIVSMADKYHNANAILKDYREIGEGLWNRFNGGREGSLWYYEELVKVITPRATGRLERLGKALENTVEMLVSESAVSSNGEVPCLAGK